jgi:hypothetical protein
MKANHKLQFILNKCSLIDINIAFPVAAIHFSCLFDVLTSLTGIYGRNTYLSLKVFTLSLTAMLSKVSLL